MNTPKQFTRRSFIRSVSASAVLPLLGTVGALSSWADTDISNKTIQRYPDPAIEVLDPRFKKYKIGKRCCGTLVDRCALVGGTSLVR